MTEEEVLRRLRSLQERGGLRRVAAILFHRRAGFSANGMGVWAVPEDEILETGKRMAAFRGISHCYQRPTYPDWPYSVFTMAHGRSKEECDAILDSIAEQHRHRRAGDALLEHGVQEGPDALLHGGLRALGTGARALETLARPYLRSAELYRRAVHVLPGGVNSPVRAMRAIGRDPVFIERAEGAEITDVDGNTLRGLRVLVGAADPRARAPRDRRGGTEAAGARHELRRADGGRGGAGRARRPADAGRGHAAHDVVGHGGVDERDPPRPRGDRAGRCC